MPKILSMTQFRVWYGIGRPTIRRMLQAGDLQGFKTSAGWCIVDPGPVLLQRLFDRATEIEQASLLRGVEVAQLLSMSSRRLRQLAVENKIHYEWFKGRRLYPLAEVRRLLAERERGLKRGTRTYARPAVISWARKRLALEVFESIKAGVPAFPTGFAAMEASAPPTDTPATSMSTDQDANEELRSPSGKTLQELILLREKWAGS